MQIIHASDTHLGARPYGIPQLRDHVLEAFNKLIEYVVEAKPDFLVISGDVLDRPKPETEIIHYLVRKLKEVTRHGVKVVLAHGEHDTPSRRDKTNLEVIAEALDGVYAPRVSGESLEERVSRSILRFDEGTIAVYQFIKAHPDRQREYASLILPLYSRALDKINGVKLFVAHIGIEGVLFDNATHANIRDLPKADYAALGHHHGRWYWRREGDAGPKLAVYPGSLYPLNIREVRSDTKRGPLLVDLSSDEPVIQEEYEIEVAKHVVVGPVRIEANKYLEAKRRLVELVERQIRGLSGEVIVHAEVKIGPGVSRSRVDSIVAEAAKNLGVLIVPKIETTHSIRGVAGREVSIAGINPVEIIKASYGVSQETAELILALKDALSSGDLETAEKIIDELTTKGELLKIAARMGLR